MSVAEEKACEYLREAILETDGAQAEARMQQVSHTSFHRTARPSCIEGYWVDCNI